eukprot:5852469-Pyramimonas_sp.AAC.1
MPTSFIVGPSSWRHTLQQMRRGVGTKRRRRWGRDPSPIALGPLAKPSPRRPRAGPYWVTSGFSQEGNG